MQKNTCKDSVLILSGGMDSVTMLYEYAHRIGLAITYDYGGNLARKEIECAKFHCQKKGIEHRVIVLDFFRDNLSSALLSGSDSVEDTPGGSSIIPFRNAILLSIACGIAESNGFRYVYSAIQGSRKTSYPDCSLGFIRNFTRAAKAGTSNRVETRFPYSGLDKSKIVERGFFYGVDFDRTYTCYRGGEIHCGHCAACFKRKRAFIEADVTDTTIYEI